MNLAHYLLIEKEKNPLKKTEVPIQYFTKEIVSILTGSSKMRQHHVMFSYAHELVITVLIAVILSQKILPKIIRGIC